MISTLVGRRCVSLRRFRHRFAGEAPSDFGPVEFGWEDGKFTTVDVTAEWTLDVSEGTWTDPFEGASREKRDELAAEVGLWEPAPLESNLSQVLGRTVWAADTERNAVEDISGIRLTFEGLIVKARVENGNLDVTVDPA